MLRKKIFMASVGKFSFQNGGPVKFQCGDQFSGTDPRVPGIFPQLSHSYVCRPWSIVYGKIVAISESSAVTVPGGCQVCAKKRIFDLFVRVSRSTWVIGDHDWYVWVCLSPGYMGKLLRVPGSPQGGLCIDWMVRKMTISQKNVT